MTAIKLVIMDMGNTLLDFHSGVHTDEEKDGLGLHYMQAHLLAAYGVHIPVATLKTAFLEPWYGDFYLRQQLIELDVTTYLKPLLATYGLTLNRENYIQLMDSFYTAYKDEVVMSPSVWPLLNDLKHKGIKLAIASNCILFDEIYLSIFSKLGIDHYIDKFVFSYSRQMRKPDLRIFNEILNYFETDPASCLMLGDSYAADILPAKSLGMQTLWINRKNEIRQENQADRMVRTIEEACTRLQALTSESLTNQ